MELGFSRFLLSHNGVLCPTMRYLSQRPHMIKGTGLWLGMLILLLLAFVVALTVNR